LTLFSNFAIIIVRKEEEQSTSKNKQNPAKRTGGENKMKTINAEKRMRKEGFEETIEIETLEGGRVWKSFRYTMGDQIVSFTESKDGDVQSLSVHTTQDEEEYDPGRYAMNVTYPSNLKGAILLVKNNARF
jgi:hypothetical protein